MENTQPLSRLPPWVLVKEGSYFHTTHTANIQRAAYSGATDDKMIFRTFLYSSL